MSNSWRDFADQMTDRTRALLETAELRGEDPDELRRFAESVLDQESFQLACSTVADDPSIAEVDGSQTTWLMPDDRNPQTYREVTVASVVVETAEDDSVTVDTMAEVDLDGNLLRSFLYLSSRELTTLTAAEARQVADRLREAADLLDSL
ncbi:hypothetical protein NWF34_06045 [Gordonia sp. GONU]|uniref:hypothetical protein n=1 Tax=Gordonia sp. GONU TaxID=2972949 RepID=UPI0021ACAA1E|nr:hypothetical protein [Gordonia sp. GONU]MCR8896518.1 hypothetical protein [Gordonia sp. GONU]